MSVFFTTATTRSRKAQNDSVLVFRTHSIYAQMVKISAPYWFHLISYETRIFATSVAMGLACFLVGTGGLMRVGSSGGGGLGLGMQLFGVSFMSLACSLGEVRETDGDIFIAFADVISLLKCLLLCIRRFLLSPPMFIFRHHYWPSPGSLTVRSYPLSHLPIRIGSFTRCRWKTPNEYIDRMTLMKI